MISFQTLALALIAGVVGLVAVAAFAPDEDEAGAHRSSSLGVQLPQGTPSSLARFRVAGDQGLIQS
jgi:hypothetical protein